MSREFFHELKGLRKDPSNPHVFDEAGLAERQELAPVLDLLPRRLRITASISCRAGRHSSSKSRRSKRPNRAGVVVRTSVRRLKSPLFCLSAPSIGLWAATAARDRIVETPQGKTDCVYSPEQLQTMLVVLSGQALANSQDRLKQVSSELASCMVCHETLLRPRLNSAPVSGRLPKIQ